MRVRSTLSFSEPGDIAVDMTQRRHEIWRSAPTAPTQRRHEIWRSAPTAPTTYELRFTKEMQGVIVLILDVTLKHVAHVWSDSVI